MFEGQGVSIGSLDFEDWMTYSHSTYTDLYRNSKWTRKKHVSIQDIYIISGSKEDGYYMSKKS